MLKQGRTGAVSRARKRPLLTAPVRLLMKASLKSSMRRRLAFTVFSEVPVYYAVLADALVRHVSAAAAMSCLSRYTLQDAKTLRTLVDAAFGTITIRVLEVQRRMPASAESVVEAMARAPYARDVLPWRSLFVTR